jgi:proteasome lid subunit RPN8/RPN11
MLNIDHKLLSEIAKHAVDEYPRECCGVLLGQRDEEVRHVAQIVRCRNSHHQPATRYEIDPVELISVQRDARDLELEIVGFYHSHPDHPATFSDTDVEEANWAGCSYLILGVERQIVTATRSYVLNIRNEQRAFIEEPMIETAIQP